MKTTKFKKALSLVMAMVVLLTSVNLTVFAAGSSTTVNLVPNSTKTVDDGTRTVTGTMGNHQFIATQNSSPAMTMLYYSVLNDRTGVWERPDYPYDDNGTPKVSNLIERFIKSSTLKASDYSYYYPEVHYRTEAEYNALPSDVQSKYTKVAWSNLKSASNTNAAALQDLLNYYDNNPGITKPAYVYKLKTLDGWWNPIQNGIWWEWVLMSPGERVQTSYGNAIYIDGKTKTNPRLAVMVDKNGREAITYCMDVDIASYPGDRYTLENLEQATYFGGTAAEIEAAKLGIRTVAQYGYWGQSGSVAGSRRKLASDIVALLNSSNHTVLTSKTYKKTDGKTTTYSKEALIDFIDIGGSDSKLSKASELTNNTALLGTQAAIWTYGRSGYEFEGFKGVDNNNMIVLQIVYNYLTSDYLKNKVKVSSATSIIDEDSFYDPNSIKITVKDKANHANNNDSNANNDIYNVDISFTMYYDLNSSDNLTVTLKNSSGTTIKSAKLGSTGIKRNGRTYTFENLQLAENSDVQYTLSIAGTQTLVKDAYIFNPAEGANNVQTMVGVGTGTNTVNASSSFKFKYAVTEKVETVTVSGSKTWDDANNQDGKRPTSITIKLYADGTYKQSQTVTSSNGWKWTFSNLPKYNGSKVISYTIQEEAVTGYTTTVNGYNVTNKHTPETVTISGAKTWSDNNNQDGKRPTSITINLLANGTKVATKTVTASDNWKWSFTNQPKYSGGKAITYTITETSVNGYTTSVSGYNVTNTHTPETTSVSGSKTWDDNNNQDGKRPTSITINLLENGTKVQSKTVTASDGWKWTFSNLPKYKNGSLITYTVTEEEVAGYTTTVNGYNVTNKYIPETTSVSGSKTWDDNNNQEDTRPTSITINLLANGTQVQSKTVTASDNWSWTFTNLPKYQNGQLITYTITENAVLGYETTINGYNVTNKYIPEKVTVSGNKNWDDNYNQDGIRPNSITINLLADGVLKESKVVTESDNWSWSFTNLNKYRAGKEIVYTITEDAVEGYKSTIAGYNVTNTHTPETVEVSGSKTWNDDSNRDGLRPNSITINLYANGELKDSKVVTAANGWNWTFANLPKYQNGQLIAYTITENEVEGYTTTVEGYNVTNTHVPATVEVSGSKTWDDKDNQDGLRPDSITIRLLANGEEVDSKVVTKDNWSWKFENLPKYEAGAEITYTITEDKVEGYTTTVNGYNVTNTHTPATVEVSGSKTWDDKDNQDGLRPDSITINLLADGVVKESKVVTKDNWSWKFENLPKCENGREIVYTITENPVAGYTTKVNGYNVTNTHVPATVEVSGSKTWVDSNDQDGLRPERITIRLYADGEEVATKVVTAADNWKYTFENLPKYANGVEITYTISEDEVTGYTTVVTGYNVTNTHVPATVEVSGNKTWNDANNQDGKRPASITINLYANGVFKASKTVTEADNWSWKFENLDKCAAGAEIVYSITEDKVDGYETKVNDFNVTNTHTPETIEVSGEKTWVDNHDQDGIRPDSITIHLYADGEKVATKVVTAADDWKYTFEELPKYKAGVEIVYTITEDEVAGYKGSAYGYNLSNIHIPGTVVVNGEKTWMDNDDQDGIRPESITIRLFANGKEVRDKIVTEADNWAWTFDNLPKYENGTKIVYTITEDAVPGYTTTVEGYNVTNTHTPAKTEVSGTKTWVDNNNAAGERPDSITINLFANGTKVTDKVVTASDNWTWTFDNLDKYENGTEIVYTITENAVARYVSKVNDYNVTNTYAPELVEVSGSKTWNDDDNRDGIRPDSITINLFADGVFKDSKVVTKDNWSWKFEELPKYNAGVEIVYTITEDAVEGYTTTVNGYDVTNTHTPETTEVSGSKTWDDNDDQDGIRPDSITINLLANGTKVASKVVTKDSWNWTFDNLKKYEAGVEIVYTITEEVVEGYTTTVNGYDVTNTHTPETTEVSGIKEWLDNNDQDGIRPDSITVNLLANGTQIDSVTVTKDDWSFTFSNLPKYEAGVEIVYTITEDEVEGYTGSFYGNKLTNIHVPRTVNVSGSKTWVDNNNQDGIRPESITIHLYANGVLEDSKVVTTTDNWSFTFENLPKYEAGVEIVYTITEEAVEGYTTTVNGYNVTNTHTPETTEVSGIKAWLDNNDQDGIRPDSITVNLLANETQIDSVTVTKDDWSFTFSNLPKYEAGVEIVYTITEDEVEGYTGSFYGNKLTNIHVPGTVNVSGSKTWVDNNNQDGIRPESITINLLANGEKVASKEVTAADDWKYTFAGLPKYEAGEEIVYTITEDAVEGYTTVINGYNVTNTHVASTRVVFGGTKYLDDVVASGFQFKLMQNGNVLETVTSKEDGTFVFGAMTFTNAGEYKYQVAEVIGDDENIWYDENVYDVTVTVTVDGEVLKAVVETEEIKFYNLTLEELPDPEIPLAPTPSVTPEPTPEVTPEPTPEVTPEPTPEVTPEPTPEVTPEPTPEVTPEPTPEVTPEPTPEVTPEVTPDDSLVEIPEEEVPLAPSVPVTGDRDYTWLYLTLAASMVFCVVALKKVKEQENN